MHVECMTHMHLTTVVRNSGEAAYKVCCSRGTKTAVHVHVEVYSYSVARRKQQRPGISKNDKNNGTIKTTNKPPSHCAVCG